MVLQTANNYPETMGLGFEGGAADGAPKHCITGVNESEAMPYGRAVQFDSTGTIDRSVKLTDGATPPVLGVTMRTQFDESFDSDLTGVAQVSTVTVGGGVIADGDTWTITLVLPGGGQTVHQVVRAAGVPADFSAVAAALRADINADATASLVVTAGGAGADVVITADNPGSFGVLTEVVDGGGSPTLVHALTTGGEADGIKQNEEANLMTRGTMWVRPEDAVTRASGVFFRTTANAGVGTALGAFRGADDGGNTEDISAFARWLTSSEGGAEGGLAKLEINLPGG